MLDDMEDDENDSNVEFDVSGAEHTIQFAEAVGGPVDGSMLPVPVATEGVIISGYNHNTGDMMHYRLDASAEAAGNCGFVYTFLDAKNAPDLSLSEFLQEASDFEDRLVGDDDEDDEFGLFEGST